MHTNNCRCSVMDFRWLWDFSSVELQCLFKVAIFCLSKQSVILILFGFLTCLGIVINSSYLFESIGKYRKFANHPKLLVNALFVFVNIICTNRMWECSEVFWAKYCAFAIIFVRELPLHFISCGSDVKCVWRFFFLNVFSRTSCEEFRC